MGNIKNFVKFFGTKQALKIDNTSQTRPLEWTKYQIRLVQVILSVKYYLIHSLIDWHITQEPQEDILIICLQLQGNATPMASASIRP